MLTCTKYKFICNLFYIFIFNFLFICGIFSRICVIITKRILSFPLSALLRTLFTREFPRENVRLAGAIGKLQPPDLTAAYSLNMPIYYYIPSLSVLAANWKFEQVTVVSGSKCLYAL